MKYALNYFFQKQNSLKNEYIIRIIVKEKLAVEIFMPS